MLTLSLESATESLDLNELMDFPEGVQAIAGLIGFGLPPVDVQWTQGAGDGASFRGQRHLPRDIELPLFLAGNDREALKAIIGKLSRIATGPMTLRLRDNFDAWYAEVHRVGGGDYAYGTDTTGERDMILVLSLRAGSPCWTRDEEVVVNQVSTIADFDADNPGSAPAIPVWELTGPGMDFKLTSDAGEVLHYTDLIASGDKVFIDAEIGSVVDELGNNKYAGLAAAPKFFRVPPGRSTIQVDIDRNSTEFLGLASANDFNYVLNPTFDGGIADWTVSNATYVTHDATLKAMKFASTLGLGRHSATASITGLTIGDSYNVRVQVQQFTHDTGTSSSRVTVTCGSKTYTAIAGPVEGTFELVIDIDSAEATTATIKVEPPYSGPNSYTGPNAHSHEMYVHRAHFGEASVYFDGSTTDTSTFTYSWSGTAHASMSIRTPVVDTDLTAVKLTFKPRDWMVV